jgi:N-formylglutamate amidohydrolase
VAEGLARIDAVYKPYHRLLRQLVLDTRVRFGHAVLLDCHSMPSTARTPQGRVRPDIVIGDRYGTSCAGALTDFLATQLARRGYSVARNKPYAGGFITEHYGQPQRGLHAVQVEFNRRLYMDERSLEKSAGFARLADDFAAVVSHLGAAIVDGLLSGREAAE